MFSDVVVQNLAPSSRWPLKAVGGDASLRCREVQWSASRRCVHSSVHKCVFGFLPVSSEEESVALSTVSAGL